MNHIKLFESFNVQSIIDKVDDIAAYIPTKTEILTPKWTRPDFNLGEIISEEEYEKYHGYDKNQYLRYYGFTFNEISNFFLVESDIRNRCNHYGLKFFIVNTVHIDREYYVILFTKEDWNKLDIKKIIKNYNDKKLDILFEDDVKIERSEFDIIYEDDDIMAVKPKTYRSAIRYSSDTFWKSALKRSEDWVNKYMTPGSYYGGINWYKSTSVSKKIESWWRKLLKLPPKESKIQLKEFFNDFPRYLSYIVIFKRLSITDSMAKIHLLYDVSRSEYGELPRDISFNGVSSGQYWGDMLDAAHNQVKVTDINGKRITFKDISKRHHGLFNRAFREIESDFYQEKDKLYNLLGFWADKGGEYRDDALVFIRSRAEPDRLQVTRPSFVIDDKEKNVIRWNKLGYYDDEDFDYWELGSETPVDKEVPNQGRGYKDYFQTISDEVNILKNALDDKWKL